MTYPIIKIDNYILITSDELVEKNYGYSPKSNEIFYYTKDFYGKGHESWVNIIAHLPLNNEPILEDVPLLPPLPNEEDVEKLAEKEITFIESSSDIKGMIISSERCGFVKGFLKAKEKYKFTEEDMRKAKDYGNGVGEGRFLSWSKFIESISQPKLPVGFKCETISLKQLPFNVEMSVDEINKPKIYKGVMQGEWIFE